MRAYFMRPGRGCTRCIAPEATRDFVGICGVSPVMRRFIMRRAQRIGIFSLVMTLFVAACAGPQAPSGQEPGAADREPTTPRRITAAILDEPTTLSQAINTAGTGSRRGVGEVEKIIHAGLTLMNSDGVLIAQLAEAVPSLENGMWTVHPDGRMETTWNIRDGVRWHDGTPLTTADLVFTADVVRDPDVAVSGHPAYKTMDAVTAVDDRTVTVSWKEAFIAADQLFSYEAALLLPKHLLEQTYLNEKAALLELPYWTTGFVGAGPFKLSEYVQSSHMIVQANEAYTLGRPKLDQITIRFIPDPNTMVANLLAGEVDVTLGRGLALDQAQQADDQWANGHLEASSANWIAHYVQQLTPNPPVLGDVRFRQALIHAMDRQAMSDQLQGGAAPIAHSYLYINAPEYQQVESQIVKYTYDPARAAQLVEQLGYAKQTDGFFADSAGQRLVIESRTNAGDDLKEKILLASNDAWQQIGIGVNTVIVPRQQSSDREFRATNPGMDLVRQPWDPLRFHSREIPNPDAQWRGDNRTRYSSPELDAAIDRYFTSIDRNERIQAIGQFVQNLSVNLPALGTIYPPEPIMISDRLVNVGAAKGQPLIGTADETWNVHLWDVK
ncbi:MAG: hypothetical protein GEU73_09295 [Chloroflexi bacterium]|nr:hypothetical protein [Chloroflexota bacterium]